MRSSILWLCWLVLPVFVLAFHYGPGQVWLARDQAASLISKAEAESATATAAQETAYQSQLNLLTARQAAFVEHIDWQAQPEHPLAIKVIKAKAEQDEAYEQAAEIWHGTATMYGEAAEKLLKSIGKISTDEAKILDADRNLLESLRWAEARALVRSGEVFNGIEQLQALLDLRTAEANQQAASVMQLTSTASKSSGGHPENGEKLALDRSNELPMDAIREELAAAQYVGARLLREEGRPAEVWRPISTAARQHYRYLSGSDDGTGSAASADVVKSPTDASPPATAPTKTASPKTASPKTAESTPAAASANVREAKSNTQSSTDRVDREQRMQRNLEQVLNLEQTPSDQLEGIPLPKSAPLARRPGDGQPGNQPGKGPGKGPLQDGPPGNGAGIPQPWGGGW
ncbi:MAG: hypothetical protein ABJZ55_04970 [Fuerstiella sp.]